MLYFLVYNDNTHNIYLEKLLNSVKAYGNGCKIIVYNKNNIDKEFYLKNKEILDLPRGGGYWLWKPYIINETLKRINDNDIIFYLDSKYYFTQDFTNLYKKYMENNDILLWKNKPNEPIFLMKNWCKMDVIIKYNMFNKVFIDIVEDCWAGALVIKKNENSTKYIKEWLDMGCVYEDITDFPSKIPNDKFFREHRHDQSLLSIIAHKYNINLLFFEKKYLQNIRQPY